MTATKPKFAANLFSETGRLYVRDEEFWQYTGAYTLDAAQAEQVRDVLAVRSALPNSLRNWLDDHADAIGRDASILV